jgi:hypothetical protein
MSKKSITVLIYHRYELLNLIYRNPFEYDNCVLSLERELN